LSGGPYGRALGLLSAWAGACLVTGYLADAAAGWALFAAGLLAAFLYNVHILARLMRWLARPLPENLPEGRGSWAQLLRGLHRHEREAVRRQEALADDLARLRRAAEALPDGVVILDADNRIEWCNDTAAAHLGLDARADAGQPIANLVRDPHFVAYLGEAPRGTPAPIQVALGNDRVHALQVIPYAQAQKLLLTRDVTQAERLETMRRDFVANVSHELRTPLTVLVGFLETVQELKLDPQRLRDYLAMMQEQAKRMQRIIDDLLTLSQLESAPPPAAERVRIPPLLARVREDALALSGGRHEISLDARPEVDLIGAEAELASAFGNLVNNAVRYTPTGGKIRILWSEAPDGVRFAVEDSGVGIAAEHLPRLTERFYRVDRGRSRDTGGTGLGLAIVKHALARHDARLDIESAPGKGSRFSARFPSRRTSPAAAVRAEPRP
jgi:two-component system phosphate regulon sensor histidine kinase PhoR